MFGSLDCMHWTWKNCPVAWQGQFQDKDKNRSVILEAIADQSLWIWHAFFGLPGGNNDINVLDQSPLISNMLRGDGKDLNFIVNGHVYPRFYLLTDGIYYNGIISSNLYMSHKERRGNTLPRCKKVPRKM
jgi:hypothetical protein